MQLDQARDSLNVAADQVSEHPAVALSLAYDAARKSVVAMLEAQGLGAKMPNAHANVQEALRAQWGDGLADRFSAARTARHRAEYPTEATTGVASQAAQRTVVLGEELLHLAEKQLPILRPFSR